MFRVTHGPLRRARGGALRSSGVLAMRFDKVGEESSTGAPASPGSSSTAGLTFIDLPESMQPKKVAPHFTPFPLPKYDRDMGFGPVRLSDIPDVELAAQRMRKTTETPGLRGVTFDGDDINAAFLAESMAMGEEDLGASEQLAGSEACDGLRVSSVDDEVGSLAAHGDPDDLGDGYAVEGKHFPTIDLLRCQRSLDDLLSQFMARPSREARTATVIDLASTMQSRSDAEMERMLYELGALFTANGNGLQFLVASVSKFGRTYHAADELMKAFIHFVDAATETLVVEQPERLVRSPALFAQLLHFLALIKVFDPNLWYSPNPNSPSNRGDYSHARGVNNGIANRATGEELYDYMAMIAVADGTPEAPGASPLLERCSDEQLLDLLAGFGGVMRNSLPESDVANAILDHLLARWLSSNSGGVLATEANLRNLERLYMLLNLFNMETDTVLAALLSSGGSIVEGLRGGTVTLALGPQARDLPRGPDFFASASRDKRASVKARAAELLMESMRAAKGASDEATQAALAESGFELLMAMPDKKAAIALAEALGLDDLLLSTVPHMGTVARRLSAEKAVRQHRLAKQLSHVQPRIRQVLEQVRDSGGGGSLPSAATESSRPSYVTMFEGKRVHPIRTLLSDLVYINQLDSAFIVHSSITGGAIQPLVALARRLQNGKDTIIVSTSCLRAFAARAHYSRTGKERRNALRALDIIGYELEKGSAMLLPPTEELALHDAGAFCDEDLMLWTVAAFFARELPLLRVNTLMSSRSTARDPHKHLKGEHSPLTATTDLYSRDVPLLQSLRSKELRSVTHHVRLQRKVRDRESRLHDVNPSRSRFVYRRDKAMFDKYHVTARNLAPGFSRGALNSDLRGLGYYTPDHQQTPFRPVTQKLAKHATAASEPLPWSS